MTVVTTYQSKHRGLPVVATLLLVGTLLSACQQSVKPSGESQTIGGMLERNGQGTDRLFMEKLPPKKIADIDAESQRVEAAALNHYQSILTLDSAPGVRAEAMRRSADLRIESAGQGLDINAEEVALAIGLYRDLLLEFPDYPNKDHVIYQLARGYELSGRAELAIDTLRGLAEDFPQSSRANDALFRSAEMLYLRKRYADAAAQYGKLITQDAAMPYWQMAQYKYGWSQYQLGRPELAVDAFTAILMQLKPRREVRSVAELTARAPAAKAELLTDSLRGLCLALAAKPEGHNINTFFASLPGKQFSPLVYSSLGELLLAKQRYTDAASVFDDFASANPQHDLAISYSEKAISAYKQGGFTALMIAAQEAYIKRYGNDIVAAAGADIAPGKLDLIRDYMAEVLRFRHAEAQQTPDNEANLRQARFVAVAAAYREMLGMFPNDPAFATTSMRYADALFDAGELNAAARQYTLVAYDLLAYDKAGDAALAAVKAYRAWLAVAPAQERDAAQQAVIAASAQLASVFPQHPERSLVLLASAEDLYALKRYDEVLALCVPLLAGAPLPTSSLTQKALSVTADAYFAQYNYAQAEIYYSKLLPMLDTESALQKMAADRLSVSVYRRAEVARDAGDNVLAADLFMRAAQLSPTAELRANASFDAAGQFYASQNWREAASVLQDFLGAFPRHAMAAEGEKLLAETYQKSGQPVLAAGVYAQIAKRGDEAFETRRQASALAARLYDSAGQTEAARTAIRNYIAQFPAPLLEAQQFRQRLATMAAANSVEYLNYLREIIAADQAAEMPLAASQLLAADASLQLAMVDVERANSVELKLPIANSLPRRQRAMQTAIDSLARAATYGFADITTIAGHELGELYRHFAAALMKSEVPRELHGDVLAEYTMLLEEQAYPFEEKAISAFETNLARVREGVWTAGMRKSLVALAELAPAKYGKQPELENSYDSLN